MKGLLFTYLMTYGGAVAAIFNPFIGLMIYISFALIRPPAMWYWSVQPGGYARFIGLALLIGWAMNGFGRWQLGRATVILVMLVFFWLWAAIASVPASNKDVSMSYLEEVGKIVLVFMVGLTLIDSVQKLKILAWVIVLSEGYLAYELNWAYYGGFNRIVEDGYGGLDNNCIAIELVTVIGVALFLTLHTPEWWLKGLALACTVLMAHVVMFSQSRGGMLALIITVGLTFYLMPKQPKHYLIFVVMLLIGIRLAGPSVIQRFVSTFADEKTRDTSAQSRLDLWACCWDSMLSSPILGVGPNHWGLIVPKYGFAPGKSAHSLWLQCGAELGFPGVTFLVSFYLICIVRLWSLTSERTPVLDPWHRCFARMVIASLVGFAVAAQFVSMEGLEVPYYVNLLGAGTLRLASVRAQQTSLAWYPALPAPGYQPPALLPAPAFRV
jgi:probable O-glycosylation ligase (exosortase A-associated)